MFECRLTLYLAKNSFHKVIVALKSFRFFLAKELSNFRSHLWWNTDWTVVFVKPNCSALSLQNWLHKKVKECLLRIMTVSENYVQQYKCSSGSQLQTSWFGSLKMKWSKIKRTAEPPEILTFTTNLSPLY